jgi:antitoxin VapB
MGIFIKNPEVERKARELARLTGKSLTAAVEEALDRELAAEREKPRRRPSVEEIMAATEEFRRKVGLDKVKLNVTRADFDALWDIEPGVAENDTTDEWS